MHDLCPSPPINSSTKMTLFDSFAPGFSGFLFFGILDIPKVDRFLWLMAFVLELRPRVLMDGVGRGYVLSGGEGELWVL